jgi:hypothetical protein
MLAALLQDDPIVLERTMMGGFRDDAEFAVNRAIDAVLAPAEG